MPLPTKPYDGSSDMRNGRELEIKLKTDAAGLKLVMASRLLACGVPEAPRRTLRSLAKSSLFSLVICFELAVFTCVSLSSAAFAKDDPWMGCRGSDFDARIVSCSRLIERGRRETKSNQITAYINRGAAYRAKGDFDRALADLDKALQLDPKSVHALTERAVIYFAKGEFDRAIFDYDAAISGQSRSSAAFYGRGEAYREKNDLDRAIADYDKALQIDKDSAAAHLGRAKAYRGKGVFDKALADFDEALKLDPKSALTHIDRGAIYQAEGDFDRAIADYDEAIQFDPNDANAFLGRANSYRGKHDLERTKQDLQAALRRDPRLAAAKGVLDEVNGLLTKSAASPTAAAPTAASAPAPAVSPALLVLLALVALIGLFAIIVINFRSKPVDKSAPSGSDQHARPRDGYLAEVSRLPPSEACARAESSLEGLSQTEADARLKKFALNLVAREGKATILQELWSRARNPLNGLLLSLATVSYFWGTSAPQSSSPPWWSLRSQPPSSRSTDPTRRPPNCAPWCTLRRAFAAGRKRSGEPFAEIPMEQLVPGDIVRLSAGDMIPADLRLLEAKDLFVNQSALTGEAMPVEKSARAAPDARETRSICRTSASWAPTSFSGYATGVIVRTGRQTFFGQLADRSPGDACRPASIRASTGSPG